MLISRGFRAIGDYNKKVNKKRMIKKELESDMMKDEGWRHVICWNIIEVGS